MTVSNCQCSPPHRMSKCHDCGVVRPECDTHYCQVPALKAEIARLRSHFNGGPLADECAFEARVRALEEALRATRDMLAKVAPVWTQELRVLGDQIDAALDAKPSPAPGQESAAPPAQTRYPWCACAGCPNAAAERHVDPVHGEYGYCRACEQWRRVPHFSDCDHGAAPPAQEAKKRHRCMRCHGEFDCRTPDTCVAKYDVLPSIVQRGAAGSIEVVEHECGSRRPLARRCAGGGGGGADALGVCDSFHEPHARSWLCVNRKPTPPAVAGPKEGANG